MKLKNNSVVGLLTNFRWDWLNLIFCIKFIERGGKVKSNFYDEGGRGGKAKSDF